MPHLRRSARSVATPLTLLLLAVLAAGPSGVRARPAAAVAGGGKPNIVFILSDDQRWDSLWAMPRLRNLVAAHGVTFSNAFLVNSLCCPSRASILTGKYSHGTGVYRNAPPNGGFSSFNDSSTIATWLHAAGYHTALIGKYLNGYAGPYIPPGWDRWFAFAGSAGYYHYRVWDQGRRKTMDSGPRDYSTYLLARRAVDFIRRVRSPFFLYFAPHTPHLPATPAPQDANAFAHLRPDRPPSFNESDVSDKPAWIRKLPQFSPDQVRHIDEIRRMQYQSLRALDRVVASIVHALADTGRLHNTMIVFMTDNGFTWGEHRLMPQKQVPYEESIRTPFVVRYDPLTRTARTDRRMVLNIDVAPTFAALAGVTAAGADGRSLLPLLRRAPMSWRSDFLIEHEVQQPGLPLPQGTVSVPTYCAVRTTRYIYVEYQDGEQELYDLKTDPYELTNIASQPSAAPIVAQLQARVAQLCNPPPPGFVPGTGGTLPSPSIRSARSR